MRGGAPASPQSLGRGRSSRPPVPRTGPRLRRRSWGRDGAMPASAGARDGTGPRQRPRPPVPGMGRTQIQALGGRETVRDGLATLSLSSGAMVAQRRKPA